MNIFESQKDCKENEMNDHELLKFAALASGFVPYWSTALDDWEKELTLPYVNGKEWNPLGDDGDVMRLAVDLRITFRIIGNSVIASGVTQCNEYINDDPHTAARRAIVRAAADIGKQEHKEH